MNSRYVSSVLKIATGEVIFHFDKLRGKQVGDKFCLTAKLGSSKNVDCYIIIEKSVSIMRKKNSIILKYPWTIRNSESKQHIANSCRYLG